MELFKYIFLFFIAYFGSKNEKQQSSWKQQKKVAIRDGSITCSELETNTP